MEKTELSKKDFWVKELLGLPFYITALFIAVTTSGGNALLSLFIIISIWYLYSLIYWKAYQHFVLSSKKRGKAALYVSIISLQVIFIVGAIYFLSPSA